jgi:hypothetical protein
MSRDRVTIDGVWSGNWVFAHSDTARDYTLRFSIAHTLMSIITSSLSLLGSGFQRGTFPFLWVPKVSPASATSF